MESGTVFNLQRYSLHDGPGIRTTVFLKGCPLCCAWCHNPESLSSRPEIVVAPDRCLACGECRAACEFGQRASPGQDPGALPLPPRADWCTRCADCVEACPTEAREVLGRTMTVPEVLAEVRRDRIFYDDSGGGVTLSGGEPLMQPRFLLALLQAFRDQGIHAALDTTGYGCTDTLLAAGRLAAVVLYDLKAFDDTRHRELTGVSNRVILSNLSALAAVHRDIRIRVPLVPGLNDDPTELAGLAGIVAGLPTVRQVDLLPFHRTGLHKYERLGRTHRAAGIAPPTEDQIRRAKAIFTDRGLDVRVGG